MIKKISVGRTAPQPPNLGGSSPWAWVPTLYFAEGLPYVAVMTISLIMYKRLGLSNTDITLYTSWLYLPWVIKPLWSPFIDIIRTKRWWIVAMQLLIGAALGGVAFTIPGPYWLQGSLAFFWLMAFSSATHDIAADGFYMLGLEQHEQAYFVGIRSTFYRIATIVGQGLLVMLAGNLEVVTRNIKYSWSITFYGMAGLFIAFWLWHNYILPRPAEDKGMTRLSGGEIMSEFWQTLKTFHGKILNRYGRVVFEWTDWENEDAGWDGRLNGSTKATPGVYFYIIEAEGFDGIPYNMEGPLHLVR